MYLHSNASQRNGIASAKQEILGIPKHIIEICKIKMVNSA